MNSLLAQATVSAPGRAPCVRKVTTDYHHSKDHYHSDDHRHDGKDDHFGDDHHQDGYNAVLDHQDNQNIAFANMPMMVILFLCATSKTVHHC